MPEVKDLGLANNEIVSVTRTSGSGTPGQVDTWRFTLRSGDHFDIQITNGSTVDGSPAGVYASVTALEEADPNHSHIYLVTATGKWYYWNTTSEAWTEGGTYLASASDSYLDKGSNNSVKNSILSETISFNRKIGNIVPLDKTKWAMTTESGAASSIRMLSDFIDVKPGSQLLLECDENINICLREYDSDSNYLFYAANKDLTKTASSQTQSYHGNGDIFLIDSRTTKIRIYFKFTDDRSFSLRDIVNFNMKLSYVEEVANYQQNIIDLLQKNGNENQMFKPEDFEVGSISSTGDTSSVYRMRSKEKISYNSGAILNITFLDNSSGWIIRPVFFNDNAWVQEGADYTNTAHVTLPANANKFRFVLVKITNSLERIIVPSEVVEIPAMFSITYPTSNYKENIDYISRFAKNILSLNSNDWVQAGVSGTTLNPNNIRINQLIENVGSKLLRFVAYNGWECAIELYRGDGSHLNSPAASVETGSTSWQGTGTTFIIPSFAQKIRVVLRRPDNSRLLVTDIMDSPVFLYDISNISYVEENEMLKTNRNNLMSLNPNDYENGTIFGDGSENSENSFRFKHKADKPIIVDDTKKYVLRFLKTSDIGVICTYYKVDGTFISQTQDYVYETTVLNLPTNTAKIRCVFKRGNNLCCTPTMIYEVPVIFEEYPSEEATLEKISGLDRAMFKEHIIVMTFNLGQFYNGSTKCPDDQVAEQKARYKQLFNKYAPDLVCTQENPEYANIGLTVKGSTFFEERYQYYEGFDNSFLGQMYISNKPVLEKPIKVNYSTGTDTSRYYEKTYMYFNGIKIAVFNTHLALTAEDRALELQELLAALNQEEYVILCGDFNTNNGFSELEPLTNAGYVLANGGSVGSFKTCGDLYIDNIIVSPNITIEKALVENVLFEDRHDHRPFCAMLKIGIADIWNS